MVPKQAVKVVVIHIGISIQVGSCLVSSTATWCLNFLEDGWLQKLAVNMCLVLVYW